MISNDSTTKAIIRTARKPISPIPKRKKPSRKLGINLGDKNGMWKGDIVSYGSLHDWVKYHLSKARLCQLCDEVPPYDLANISGEYKRELSDWYWLCRRCHMASDGRLFNKDRQSGKFISKQVHQQHPEITLNIK